MNREHRLLIRQMPGGLPELWQISGSRARPVTLPSDLLFLAVHPRENSLLAVQKDQIAALVLDDHGDPRPLWRLPLATPFREAHPWLPAHIGSHQNRDFLAFVQDQKLYLLRVEPGGELRSLPLPPPVSSLAEEAFPETAYLNPPFRIAAGALHFMLNGQLMSLSLEGAEPPLLATAHPELRTMEQAVAIAAAQTGPMPWFVYGGQRGELGSFGWHLHNRAGEVQHRGEGIVTRFGSTHGEQDTRWFVITVSNRVGAHLRSAISGTKTFSCQVFRFHENAWKPAGDISFSLGEKTDNGTVDLAWTTDLDGNGYQDLILVNGKQGVGAFFSDHRGTLREPLMQLAGPCEKAVFSDRKAWACRSMGDAWIMTELEAP